jgi:hypothetical protein
MLFNFAIITSVRSTTLREKKEGPGSVPQTIYLDPRGPKTYGSVFGTLSCSLYNVMQTKISGFRSMREES